MGEDRSKLSQRVKAKPINGDPSDPWRAVDSFDELKTHIFDDCSTLDKLFARSAQMYSQNPCIGTRELLTEEDEEQPDGKVFKKVILGKYQWRTFDDVLQESNAFGSGLQALGQKPRANICLFAETRADWMIAAQACFKYNFPIVTLYATLGEDAIIHGVNEAEVTHVITSSELLPKFKELLSRMPHVQHLVYMEGHHAPDLTGFPPGIQLHSVSQVKELGRTPQNLESPISNPTAKDIAVIMYTSGTTGLPKGVLMTHSNLMSAMSGQIPLIPNLGPKDIYIGYLPLAHIMELTAEISCFSQGVCIGYSSSHTLSDQSSKIKKGSKGDVTVLRPTLMAAVPFIMDRLYKAVWDEVNGSSFISQAVFKYAYGYKLQGISRGYDTPLLNKFVFKKTAALLGGRIRMMLSGGAPLSEDTQRFMNICFCCPIGQGYGLTETCGAGTITESGYTTSDKPFPRGEIVVGGGNVSMGYYKNPEKTAEEFEEVDGLRWFYTGDIGEFQADGVLKIIDRKKDLVKLQAGEYVSLGKVETALKVSLLIDDVCVYADSSKMFTVCLVVPSQKQLKALAEKQGIDVKAMEWEEMCQHPELEVAMLKVIQSEGKKAKLERFEIPTKITLCSELWTPDSGFVTAAFKLKRKAIQEHYDKDINRLYA